VSTTVDNDDTLLPVTISGVPTGWTLRDDGTAPTNVGNGTWSVTPDALASLVILPPPGGFDPGGVRLTVTASNLDTDSAQTETLSATRWVDQIAGAFTTYGAGGFDNSIRQDDLLWDRGTPTPTNNDVHLTAFLDHALDSSHGNGSEIHSAIVQNFDPVLTVADLTVRSHDPKPDTSSNWHIFA
jgi:hypothetical protein